MKACKALTMDALRFHLSDQIIKTSLSVLLVERSARARYCQRALVGVTHLLALRIRRASASLEDERGTDVRRISLGLTAREAVSRSG